MNVKVSILINNYNYGQFLKTAIDSALSQTYSDVEVIVVDDGSTDGSQLVIEKYRDKIIPILKQNGGQASAFNSGFAASQGEVICFLDADDSFKPNKIREVVDAFQSSTDIGWCFHPLEYRNKAGEEIHLKSYQGKSGKYDLRTSISKGKIGNEMPISIATSGMCFRRFLLEKILPMPEEIRITSDDYVKYAALGLSPGFVIFDKLATQLIHANNAYTLQAGKEKVRAEVLIMTAYWLKTNFPNLSKFANKIFAWGLFFCQDKAHIDQKIQILTSEYMASIPFTERIKILFRNKVNFLKTQLSWFKKL